MTMHGKKLLCGLLALVMLLSLIPSAMAEGTRMQVTLTGMYATRDGNYQSVAVPGVFDVFQNEVKVAVVDVTPGADNVIALESAASVRIAPVAGTIPAELPVNEYGYGVALTEGRLNIAPIVVYANAGLFTVDAGVSSSFELLNAQGAKVLIFQTDAAGQYALDVAIAAGEYTLRMTASEGKLWEDQTISIVTYSGEKSVLRIEAPAVESTAEPTVEPTAEPIAEPTVEPTVAPTAEPTAEPTAVPSATPAPTAAPAQGTLVLTCAGENVDVTCTVTSEDGINLTKGTLSLGNDVIASGLAQGEYIVTLKLPENVVMTGLNGTATLQRGTTQWKVAVYPDEESHYAIELSGTGSLSIPMPGIEGATVVVNGRREAVAAKADAQGVYTAKNLLADTYNVHVVLPAGKYDCDASQWKLTAKANGTYTATANAVVNAGAATELSAITCSVSGSVSGVVQDRDGDALGGVKVSIFNNNSQIIASAETNQQGKWEVTGLKYGDYIAQYAHEDQAIPATSFALSQAQPDVVLTAAAQAPAKVTVRVFVDENNNGGYGRGEDAVKDAEVSLIDGNGALVDTGLTAKDGSVVLTAPAGEYRVRVKTPLDYGFSKKGNKPAFPENIMDESGERVQESEPVTLTAGKKQEIGVGLMPMAIVRGTVWNDKNADGVWQTEEPGVPGVRLTLKCLRDKSVIEAVTDENGVFEFHQAKSGDHELVCHVPDDYVLTVRAKGDALNVSRMTREADRAPEERITLERGQVYENFSIGMMEGVVIEGVCFYDENFNGIYDEGEQTLPGVELRLARQSNNVLLQLVKSGENGEYHFVGQRGSTFTLRANLPKGCVFTITAEGENGNQFEPNGNKAERRLMNITIENGGYRKIMLGAIKYGSVSGRVYYDENYSSTMENGEKVGKGMQVVLLSLDGKQVASQRVDRNGKFSFEKVAPGEYRLSIKPEKGYGFTALGEYNVMQTQPDGTGLSRIIKVGVGQDIKDAGIGMIVPAYVSGSFFADDNDNGLKEQLEKGLAGAVIRLMSEEGEAAAITLGESSEFKFNSVIPGRYYLQYELPAKGLFAKVVEGGNSIAGADGIGRSEWFYAYAKETWKAPLCGGVLLSDISGAAFMDVNGNAVKDAEEGFASGMTITLTPSREDLQEMTVVTGADGLFALNDLHPDVYTMTVSWPEGYVLSRMQDVDMGLTSGLNSQSMQLNLKMGTQWHDQMLGCVIPATWSGEAYLDENYDGLRGADEAPAAGERIELRDAVTGEVAYTVLTDEQGKFYFPGIAPGEYELVYPLDAGNLLERRGPDDFYRKENVLTNGRVNIHQADARTGTILCVARTTEIGGTVWLEEYDGVSPVKGAKLRLLNADGKVISECTTGEDGKYLFKGLMPANYAIDVTIPAGYVLVDAGDARVEEAGLISVIEEAKGLFGKSAYIQLRMAKHRRDIDVGIVLPGRLGDKAWLDLNGNGLQDGEEGGIPGVKIDLVRGDKTVASTETDQYGYYVFEELYPAEYTLRVSWPAEVKPTVMRPEIHQISSVLQESGMTVPVTVESNKANYAADLGFVLIEEGKLPAGYGEGEKQVWRRR